MNSILDSENKRVRNQRTLTLRKAFRGKGPAKCRTKDERRPQEGTRLHIQKTENREKFLNTSRKRKEKSVRSNRRGSSATPETNVSKLRKS